MHDSIKKSLGLLLILFLAFLPYSVQAQTAAVTYSTTITYQNIGNDTAHITLLFYPEGSSTPISISRPDLPKGASATVSVGSLGSTSGFKGSAVIKADMQLAVTMTQIPSNTSVKSRPMAAGFIQGSGEIWFLFANKSTPGSVISVQNLEKSAVNLKLTFSSTSGTVVIDKNNVAGGAAAYFDLDTLNELSPGTHNIHVVATKTGSTNVGHIAGLQLNRTSNGETAFATESFSQLGKKVYMPVAMCNAVSGFSTSYYIYNTSSTDNTTVTIQYNSGKKGTITLAPQNGNCTTPVIQVVQYLDTMVGRPYQAATQISSPWVISRTLACPPHSQVRLLAQTYLPYHMRYIRQRITQLGYANARSYISKTWVQAWRAEQSK